MRSMRHFIVECLIRASYWCGLNNLFYFLNRGRKRIIMFHNILPDKLFDKDRTAEFVSNSESEFRFIVREIKKKFAISVDLQDAKSVTLTFDDGYVNQLECAKKVLDEEGRLPAIVFVAGNVVGNLTPRNALVVDLLMLWMSFVPDGIIPFRNGSRLWTWLKDLYPQMESSVSSLGLDVLRKADAIYPLEKILDECDPEYLRLRFTGLTEAQIKELRNDGWIVGWHTANHFPLSKLDSSALRQEMSPPNNVFKSSVFAYPYGGTDQVDSRCVEIANEMKYPCAVSAVPYYNNMTCKYFLPRMELRADKYWLHYELSGLRCFLISHRLLPKIDRS